MVVLELSIKGLKDDRLCAEAPKVGTTRDEEGAVEVGIVIKIAVRPLFKELGFGISHFVQMVEKVVS